MHSAGRNYANPGFLVTQRECYMQLASIYGDTQRMKPRLRLQMFDIIDNQKRFIKEHLFSFGLADAMLVDIFAIITLIPLKSGNSSEIKHLCILP